MSGRTYPPVDHLLRHLRLSLEVRSKTELIGSMPISDDLRDPSGSPRMGALATFVDVAAGTFVHEVVRPDWLATTDMRVVVRRHSDADVITVQTVLLRAGRRSVMSISHVSDGSGEFARGWVTCTRLPRREDSPAVEAGSAIGRPIRYSEPAADQRERLAFDDYLGTHHVPSAAPGSESAALDPIVLTASHAPQIHNSFGSLQGGAAAAFIEQAALVGAERTWGPGVSVTDLHTYYLGQTRQGPFRIVGEAMTADPASLTVEGRVLDAGNDNKLMVVGTAVARPVVSS